MLRTSHSSDPSLRSVFASMLLLSLLLLPAVLAGGWLMDDRELIFDNPVVRGSLPWTAAFTRDYFHHIAEAGAWRPLATLSLRFDYSLFGGSLRAYHLSNWLLHMSVVLGCALLLRRHVRHLTSLFGACALLALHPALCDSFLWISGRTSMLSAIGPLSAALGLRWLQEREAPAWSLGAVAGAGLFLGLLGKEDAVVFAPALFALAWPAGSQRRVAVALGLGLALLLAFCARWAALGAPFVGSTTPALVGLSWIERAAVGGLAWLETLRLAILPFDFPPQYTAALLEERARPLTGLAGQLAWAALFIPLTRSALHRTRPSLSSITCALIGLAFLPVAQLVPIGEVFAARFLYLPLLFATWLTARGLERLPSSKLRGGVVVTGTLLLATATYARSAIYADRGSWRLEQLSHDPSDGASWNNLGLYYEEHGQLELAKEAWLRATGLAPQYSKGWSNLGRLHLESGESEAALSAWRRALREGPSNPIAHVNLAGLLSKRGEHAEAIALYERAVELAPGLAAAWRGMGLVRLRLGDRAGGLRAVERALALDPTEPRALELRVALERLDGP